MLAERLALVRESRAFDDQVVADLGEFLAKADDAELFRMSPLRYAHRAGLPENVTIDLFLRATRAGLMDFTWGVLCEACGAFLTTFPALRSLSVKHECSMCELEASVNDDSVEVAFTVSPSVRRIRFHDLQGIDFKRDWKVIFFSPSRIIPPQIHALIENIIVETRSLAAEEELTLEPDLRGKRFAVFVPAHHAWGHVDVKTEDAPSEQRFELYEGRFVPRRTAMREGPAKITVVNRSGHKVLLGFVNDVIPPPEERTQAFPTLELRPYLTGKRLVTHQTFRELFRTESIPSEGGLEFKSLTMLFTDLKGSTEMYERIGDFRAYGLVRQHFHLLRKIIAANGGSMVKTIGDAVMASFSEAAPALEAAAAMNREIHAVRESGTELQLKIGLHTGPCIAVESNDRLDYFGQTVNIAARVQGIADANEIVITHPVFSAPRASEVMASAALEAVADRALLKGVDGEVSVYRLRAH
jgi:class 3 adenylate cyclase